MEWTYAVTWESYTQPPLTYRGAITAGSPSGAAGAAVRAAKKQGPLVRNYSSVLVLLVRKGASDDAGDDSEEIEIIEA